MNTTYRVTLPILEIKWREFEFDSKEETIAVLKAHAEPLHNASRTIAKQLEMLM